MGRWGDNIWPAFSSEYQFLGTGMSINQQVLRHDGNKMGQAYIWKTLDKVYETSKLQLRLQYVAYGGDEPRLLPNGDPTISTIWMHIRLIPAEITDPENPLYGEKQYQQYLTIPFASSWANVTKQRSDSGFAWAENTFEIQLDRRVYNISRIDINIFCDIPCEIFDCRLLCWTE